MADYIVLAGHGYTICARHTSTAGDYYAILWGRTYGTFAAAMGECAILNEDAATARREEAIVAAETATYRARLGED